MRRCTPPSRSAATAPTCTATVDESAPVRRAPISAEHRAAATAIGQWANDTATEALASVLAPQPHHRGRPSGHDRVAGDRHRPGDGPARTKRSSGFGSRACCTTSASWRSRPRSWTSPSALSDGEWQAIGEHPRIGQVILEQASGLREAIPVVLHHHERFNGGGYPHGLRGNEIPHGRPHRGGGRCLPRHGPRPAVQDGA